MDQKKIEFANSQVWFSNDNIIHLYINEGADLDLAEVQACFAAYKQLGIGPHNRVHQLIHASHANMSSEGRKFAADHGHEYFIASAVISSSTSIRLIVNFFNGFHKPSIPFKLFANEQEAMEWLKKM